MAGSILGQDQIKRVNAIYPALMAHVRSLLAADRSAYGLMKVHVAIESLDSTELAFIFSNMGFISPAEKRALVRAAIYDVLVTDGNKLSVESIPAEARFGMAESSPSGAVPLKVFNPPAFKLNVQKAEDFHGQAPADTPPPAPVVTSTHSAIVKQANKAPGK